MISLENIKYSLTNLMERKARSLLTILSIFVGIATIFIFISFGLGLYNYVDETVSSSAADKLLIQAKGGAAPGMNTAFKLTDDDIDAIAKTKGISEAVGSYFNAAEIEQGRVKKYVWIASIEPKKPLILEISNVFIEKGRELKEGDDGKCALGYNYQFDNKIFPKGLKVNDKITVNGKKLDIIGFYESVGNTQDDSNVYVTNDYYEELYDADTYALIVASADINDMEDTIERVEKNLRKHRNQEEGEEDFFVQSYLELLDQFMGALDVIVGFIILIAFISVVVSAVNTANTMVTSVLERIKEIGVIKSIGAKNSEVFNIFLFESSFLGFVAGSLGVLAGWGFSYLSGVMLTNLGWGFLTPYTPWPLFVGLIAFATLTGAISGVAPAIQASRMQAVDALRYE